MTFTSEHETGADWRVDRGTGRLSLPRNAAFRIIGVVVPLLLTVLFTPLFLRELGSDGYGLWALCMSILGFSVIADWGLNVAAAKHISASLGDSDADALLEYSTAVTLFYGVVGSGVTVLFFVLAPTVAGWFKTPPELRELAAHSVRITALGILPTYLRNGLLSIPIGFERFDLSTSVFLGHAILSMLGMALVLVQGGDLVQVMMWIVCVTGLGALAACFVAGRLIRSSAELTPRFSWGSLRRLFGFGMYVGVAGVGNRLFNSVDRLLVGTVLGTTSVTYYTIPVAIANKILSVVQNIAQVLMPRVSHLQARGQRDRLVRLFADSYKLLGYAAFFAASILYVLAPRLLEIWIGPGFALETAPYLRILSVVYALIALSSPAIHFANGLGRPGLPAAGIFLGAVVGLTAMVIFGSNGVIYFVLANLGFLVVLVVPALLVRSLGGDTARRVGMGLLAPTILLSAICGTYSLLPAPVNPWWYATAAAMLFAVVGAYDCRDLLYSIAAKFGRS